MRKLGDDGTLYGVLDSLGQNALDQDDLELAKRCWTECSSIALKLDDGIAGANSLDGMAKIAVKQGDFEKGLRLHSVAAHLRREAGHTPHPGDQQFVAASVAAARQALDARHADAIWEEGGRLNFVEAINYAIAEEHSGAATTAHSSSLT